MKSAIIVGATSGIGKGLAQLLVKKGYQVGITGRRTALLDELKAESPDAYITSTFDVADLTLSRRELSILAAKLGGLDLLVISSGTGEINPGLDFDTEQRTVTTNVTGFTNIADWALTYFMQQGSGHLTAITSIAGLRGGNHAPAYNASKAFQINYLEGLRRTVRKLDIAVTDIRPGFVDTAMAQGENLFWVAPVDKAASQIYQAIKNKRRVAYITKRWAIIAWIMKQLPRPLYQRM